MGFIYFLLGLVIGVVIGVLLMKKYGTMIVAALNSLETTIKSSIQRIEAAIQRVESAIKAAKGILILLLALSLGFAPRPAHAQSLHATVIAAHSDQEWMLTGVVPEPVAAVPLAGMGAAANPYTVVLTWTNGSGCGVTVNGSTSTCYSNVYSCQGTCTVATGTWAKIASTANSATTYTDTAPPAGGSDSYYVTDVATGAGWNGQESGPSNVSVVTFPVPAPTVTSATHS